jgi:hypothetical protein
MFPLRCYANLKGAYISTLARLVLKTRWHSETCIFKLIGYNSNVHSLHDNPDCKRHQNHPYTSVKPVASTMKELSH